MNVKYRGCQEVDSSSWSQFSVIGLESWVKSLDTEELICSDLPESQVFTILEQDGEEERVNTFNFWICRTAAVECESSLSAVGCDGYCIGDFIVICHAQGEAQASKLMDWWYHYCGEERTNEEKLAFANHCAVRLLLEEEISRPLTNIEKRNRVITLLKDPEWQQQSNRTIASRCGVSPPLVGQIRSTLVAEGKVSPQTTRIGRRGAAIDTENIGRKGKEGENIDTAETSIRQGRRYANELHQSTGLDRAEFATIAAHLPECNTSQLWELAEIIHILLKIQSVA